MTPSHTTGCFRSVTADVLITFLTADPHLLCFCTLFANDGYVYAVSYSSESETSLPVLEQLLCSSRVVLQSSVV